MAVNLPAASSALVGRDGRATPVLQQFFAALVRSIPATVRALVPLFARATTAGTSAAVEQDLYSDTLAAGQFAADGDCVYVDFTVQYANAVATRRVRYYVAGTVVYDTGAVAAAGNTTGNGWVWIVREDASTLRVTSSGLGNNNTSGTVVASAYNRITGLTLANTQILKITGQSSLAAANDITAVAESVSYLPAP
jgi:hypothetical protein